MTTEKWKDQVGKVVTKGNMCDGYRQEALLCRVGTMFELDHAFGTIYTVVKIMVA